MSRMPRLLSILSLASMLACQPERPPKPDADADEQAAAVPAVLNADTDEFVLTYAGERGVFADCKTIAEVPEAARNRVGVNVFGRKAPPGKVYVTNLTAPLPDGTYALELVPREDFEETVLGSGRSSQYELPGDLEQLVPGAPGDEIIVYKTSWCGVCKQLESYLQRKGVEYVAKDIEQDRTAAAELAAKAKAAGVPTGSVPMIDVGGKLLRGFDKNALEKLL